MLYLGLIVLRAQPHVGVVVHPLGLIGNRLHHFRPPSKPLSDLLRPPQGPVLIVLVLALVAQVVAVPTQEILPRPVQDCHPPPTCHSRTDEPGGLSPKVAGPPPQEYRFLYVLPLTTQYEAGNGTVPDTARQQYPNPNPD